jgi:heptaprenylglyceryl phosphate synthase
VSAEIIRACRAAAPGRPLFVGGGIRTPAQARAARQAGADFIVIGTVVEEGPQGELGTRGGLGGLRAFVEAAQ